MIGEVHPHVFGNFAEHLGRCIYGGIFEEGSPLADADGFRKDVMDAAQGLGVTLLRWPGGNFASGYNWKDGIGPRDQRPVRRDQAWDAIESNRFGTDEFLRYAEKLGGRALPLHQRRARAPWRTPATGSNTRTRPSNTYWAQQRRKNGRDKPWNVKIWGLGNEIDGPWQLGHKNAEDYAKFALEAAKAMRRADASIKLIASGSSNFGPGADWVGWNRTVLERLKSEIDYISLHTYIGNRDGQPREVPGRLARPRRPHRGGEGPDPGRARRQPQGPPHPHRLRRVERLVPHDHPRHARKTRSGPRAWRRSTTSRTPWPWACSSTPSSATPTS